LEASALTHASRLGLLGRRSPLLRLQGDERLIALIRDGQERAFETLFERYQARLLAFCRGMLASAEDAEDVLQEVFVAAHKAILADNRAINARPWLYRIARNRCLNHLRKPVPEGQDSMDIHPHENGVSVAERVQKREEFRALIADVQDLPETQRTALLLREIDALAYEEIAVAMDTTVPAVKSLLVRARMSLADCSQARHLTCDEVHLELAEAAEGLRKASGPARAHLRSCEPCREYRTELRRSGKALAALAPIGPLAALHAALVGKLGLGGAKIGAGSGGAGASAGASAGGAAATTAAGTGTAAVGGAAAAGGGGMALAGSAAAGGIGGALGTKAAASVASVALLTAGAVEVNDYYQGAGESNRAIERSATMAMAGPAIRGSDEVVRRHAHHAPPEAPAKASEEPAASSLEPVVETPAEPVAPTVTEVPDAVAGGAETGTGLADSGPTHEPEPGPPPVVEEPPVTDPPPVEPPLDDPPPVVPAEPPVAEPAVPAATPGAPPA
jgi:RNA polymerase sigma factor (sigma-70 family)